MEKKAAEKVSEQTVKRYSTALSGLLNAARIARSICDLSKPMLSISAIADERCWPTAKALGSLKLVPSVLVALIAGVGVDGKFAAAPELDAAAAGAGGGAGVAAPAAGAGVDGALAGVADDEEVAGAGLGYPEVRTIFISIRLSINHLVLHAYYKSLLFDLIRLHGIRIVQDFAYTDRQ